MDRQQDSGNNAQNPGGNGRRRRRRRRKGSGPEGARPPQGGQSASTQSPQQAGQGNKRRRRGGNKRRVDPFLLFAAFHLGLDENQNYRKQGPREIARRFNIQPHEIRDLLASYLIDHSTFHRIRFDITLYELDIRVAPEGIDKTAVARQIWDEYIEAAQKAGLFESYPDPDEDDEDDDDADPQAHDDDHADDDHADDDDDAESQDDGDDDDDA